MKLRELKVWEMEAVVGGNPCNSVDPSGAFAQALGGVALIGGGLGIMTTGPAGVAAGALMGAAGAYIIKDTADKLANQTRECVAYSKLGTEERKYWGNYSGGAD